MQARFARMAAGQCDAIDLLDPLTLLVADTLPASDGPKPAAVGVAESALALLLPLLRVCDDTRNVVRQQWLTSENEASIARGLGPNGPPVYSAALRHRVRFVLWNFGA